MKRERKNRDKREERNNLPIISRGEERKEEERRGERKRGGERKPDEETVNRGEQRGNRDVW